MMIYDRPGTISKDFFLNVLFCLRSFCVWRVGGIHLPTFPVLWPWGIPPNNNLKGETDDQPLHSLGGPVFRQSHIG